MSTAPTISNTTPNEPVSDMAMDARVDVDASAADSGISGISSNPASASPIFSSSTSDEGSSGLIKSSPHSSPTMSMNPKRRGSALPMKKRKSFLSDGGAHSSPNNERPPPLLAASDIEAIDSEEPAKKKHQSHGFDIPATSGGQSSTSSVGSPPPLHSPVSEKEEACLLSLAALAAAKNRSFKEQAQQEAEQKAAQAEAASQTDNDTSCGEDNDDSLITPQINDVLSSSSAFHHIGNRRFRVLVEANLSKYFEEVETEEQWQTLLHQMAEQENNGEGAPHKPSPKQSQVVEAVIESVRGNVPPGRFLIEFHQKETEEKKDDSNSSSDQQADNWKLATDEEIRSKVHSTFLAAGRFHVKQMNAALMEQEQIMMQQEQQAASENVKETRSNDNANEVGGEAEATGEQDQEEETSESEDNMDDSSSSSPASSLSPSTSPMLSTADCALANLAALAEAQRSHAHVAESIKNKTKRTAAIEQAMGMAAHMTNTTAGDVLKNHLPTTTTVTMEAPTEKSMALPQRSESAEAIEVALRSLRAHQQQQQADAQAEDRVKLEKAVEKRELSIHNRDQQGGSNNEDQVKAMEEALLLLRAQQQNAVSSDKDKLETILQKQVKAEIKDKKEGEEEKKKETQQGATISDSSNKELPKARSHLEEALRAATAAARAAKRQSKDEEVEFSKDEEVEFLKQESVRIRSILGQHQSQSQQRTSLSSAISSNYLPSSKRKSASGAAAAAAAASVSPTNVEANNSEGAAGSVAVGSSASGGLPSSIDELFANKKASSSSSHHPDSANSMHATSIEELYACGASSAATSPPSSVEEEVATETATSTAAAAPLLLVCPTRIKVFLSLAVDRFFAEDKDRLTEYIMPSNYDILCGPDRQSFFHHVGNRRFRIMIEMNARRYEKAYLASLSGDATAAAATNDTGGEAMATEGNENNKNNSIDTLIEEMVQSLAKCDPPGRFLGMEMTTGRWRVLKPLYAQLKTEQTFFECLQVEQKRQRAAAARVVQMEEEQQASEAAAAMSFHNAVEREKEILLQELEGRMMGAGLINPQQQQQQQLSRSVSQVSLASESCPTGMCPSAYALRNPLPAMNDAGNAISSSDDDLSLLQSRAKALLRRRQGASLAEGMLPQQTASSLATAAGGMNDMAMAEIVQRFAQEQQQMSQHREQVQASRAILLNQLRQTSSALPPQDAIAHRRRSLPETMLSGQPLTSLRASFSVGQQDLGGGVFGNNGSHSVISSLSSSLSSRMAMRRPSNFSCDSQDSIQSLSQTEAAVAAAAAAMNASRLPQRQQQGETKTPTSPALSSNKDLLDVVGGMMMMSRRGSC